MDRFASAKPPGWGDVLTLGFGTTLAMWAVGYVCRLPTITVPSSVVLVLMLVCLIAGGFAAGRYARRGWRGGLYTGLLASVLNLLILGSLLTGDGANQVVPSALLWVPGSILVGVVLGGCGGELGHRFTRREVDPPNWTAAFAFVAAAATLLLLVVGGMVTGYEAGLAVVDWPNTRGCNMFLFPLSRMTGGIYYEHAHRLIGSLVGLTTLVLAIHLQRVERRVWLRRLVLGALGVVIVQGVLGGLRVTGRFTFSASPQYTAPNITLAIVHGVLGQVFFAMLVAVAVSCLTTWRSHRPATVQPWAATDRAFGVLLVVLLIVQLVLGAVLRHISGGLYIHITMAVVVVLLAVNCGVRAWGLNETEPILQRTGQVLIVLTATQVVLGICALAAVGASAGAAPTGVDVLITGVHQAVGALLLACAVSLALWNFRLLAPPSTIGGAEVAS